KVDAKTRGKPCADPKASAELVSRQAQKFCGRRAGAEGSHCPARVHASHVVLRQHPLGDFTLHFESRKEGEHKSFTIDAAKSLAHHQCARQRRNRWMGEQTIDMRWIEAHLTVVPIMGMTCRADDAGRHRTRNFFIAAP